MKLLKILMVMVLGTVLSLSVSEAGTDPVGIRDCIKVGDVVTFIHAETGVSEAIVVTEELLAQAEQTATSAACGPGGTPCFENCCCWQLATGYWVTCKKKDPDPQ